MSVSRVLLVVCVLLSGCSAPIADGGAERGPDDPPADRIGWEDGHWYNESINVDQSDGLDEREREAFVARTMARVERIRGLEFERSVPVEVISRDEYRSRAGSGGHSQAHHARRNQMWEAMLLVGENANASKVFGRLFGEAVLGYYSPSREEIVIVSDSPRPSIDRATLAHELVHALQDQHFELEGGERTHDGQLARTSISEGDARYVEQLYEERCKRTWQCVPRPERTPPARERRYLGAYLVIYHPYSDGPNLVHQVRRRGGWKAVDRLYRNPPRSTEQVIHPAKYPTEEPVRVRTPDRSTREWTRLNRSPAADTVGEASVFAMLWQHRVANRSAARNDTAAYSRFDYSDPRSAGWAGDSLVPYRTGAGDDARYGYVWTLQWETERDAREFHDAYRTILTDRLNASEVRPDVYRVSEGTPFADAFRVTRRGDTVVVVNAPTVRELDEVRRPTG